jgi:glyoxylase-like metal-dependent hydrolase (beta-lactamase superfamily II)
MAWSIDLPQVMSVESSVNEIRCWTVRVTAALWLLIATHQSLAQEIVPLKAVQVSTSTWYVQGLSAQGSGANQNFISNAGFIVTPAGVVVIDALGSPALAQRLLGEIRKITPLPITDVIVTHYHADHIYGLQTFKALGARIVAHHAAGEYLNSEAAQLRLIASREELAPWINEQTRLIAPDVWLDGDIDFKIGGVLLQVRAVGSSHTPEDLVIYLPQEKVLFAGDLVFRSRIPYVGKADSRHWIAALGSLIELGATTIVPGHGPLSTEARQDMQLTRDYLNYLRTTMGKAARELEPFDDAFAATDWSEFEHLPLFRAINRMNAYNTYLLLEEESK